MILSSGLGGSQTAAKATWLREQLSVFFRDNKELEPDEVKVPLLPVEVPFVIRLLYETSTCSVRTGGGLDVIDPVPRVRQRAGGWESGVGLGTSLPSLRPASRRSTH